MLIKFTKVVIGSNMVVIFDIDLKNINIYYLMENKNLFECKICNKYYKSNVGLWKHNQIYHKLDNIDKNDVINNIKEYICIYCNKKYTNKFSKYKHQINVKLKTLMK